MLICLGNEVQFSLKQEACRILPVVCHEYPALPEGDGVVEDVDTE